MFDFCVFKQKTAYEMRISDWSSDVCSSDLARACAPNTAMTTEALSPPRVAARGALSRAFAGHAGPLAVVCLALLVLWYLGAVWLNAPVLIDGYERRDTE